MGAELIERESLTSYFRPDQSKEVRRAAQLRADAVRLRAHVMKGSYDADDLERFWTLVGSAGITLHASNTTFAERAGLGTQFFSSVARDRRRPKLQNMLKALTAIVEIGDERLQRIDGQKDSASEHATNSFRIETNAAELLLLVESLKLIAGSEIERLATERPNDPESIEINRKQREILGLLYSGFCTIESALAAYVEKSNRPTLAAARRAVSSVGSSITTWVGQNKGDVVDYGVRVPMLTAGVAALSLAGADMTVATTALAVMVGGPKMFKLFSKKD